jgi:hypothetical protein
MKIPENSLHHLVDKVSIQFSREVNKRLSLSDPKSLCSDIPVEENYYLAGLKRLDAFESLGLLLVLPILDPEVESLVRLELSIKCKKNCYQGKWMLVHKLLKVKFFKLMIYTLLEQGISTNEIFGNLLQRGIQRYQKLSIQILKPRKVKYPQRKRGYNDHGIRRDESKWLPTKVWKGPNPKKFDGQSQLGNSRKSLVNFLYG